MPRQSPPTLYKARNVPLKRPVCAICVDRTRGRTERIQLTHRVAVWLCADHGSVAFQTRRSGRDFVRTLMGVWKANDCLTAARERVLTAHLDRLTSQRPPQRPRPGSYSWPDLRHRLEKRHAEGPSPPARARRPCALRRLPGEPSQPAHHPALARPTPLAHPAVAGFAYRATPVQSMHTQASSPTVHAS